LQTAVAEPVGGGKLHKPDAGERHFSPRGVKKASDIHRFEAKSG
jgi:hypothetical protein